MKKHSLKWLTTLRKNEWQECAKALQALLEENLAHEKKREKTVLEIKENEELLTRSREEGNFLLELEVQNYLIFLYKVSKEQEEQTEAIQKKIISQKKLVEQAIWRRKVIEKLEEKQYTFRLHSIEALDDQKFFFGSTRFMG